MSSENIKLFIKYFRSVPAYQFECHSIGINKVLSISVNGKIEAIANLSGHVFLMLHNRRHWFDDIGAYYVMHAKPKSCLSWHHTAAKVLGLSKRQATWLFDDDFSLTKCKRTPQKKDAIHALESLIAAPNSNPWRGFIEKNK